MEKQFYPEMHSESEVSKVKKSLAELTSLEEKVASLKNEINTFLREHTLSRTSRSDSEKQEDEQEDLIEIFDTIKREIKNRADLDSSVIVKRNLEQLFEEYFGENNYPKIEVSTEKVESRGYITTIILNDNCYLSISHDDNDDNLWEKRTFDEILLELANKAGIKKIESDAVDR